MSYNFRKRDSNGRQVFDISLDIYPDMIIFPGDAPVRIEPARQIERGDKVNVSYVCMGSHTGTHVDPPLHITKDGQGIDNLPLNNLVGPATVIELPVARFITEGDLARHRIKEREIIIFKTRNSSIWQEGQFNSGFVSLSEEAASYLVSKKISAVGMDYLSVEPYGSGTLAVHRIFIDNGITIIEGLNLNGIPPGEYFFVCLPLKIKGGDGAPARAILIKEN